MTLQGEGWSVETCASGAAALEKLQSGERFDVLAPSGERGARRPLILFSGWALGSHRNCTHPVGSVSRRQTGQKAAASCRGGGGLAVRGGESHNS